MEQSLGIKDILNLLFKHKRGIMAICCLAAAVSYGASKTIPKPYVAKAVIMVNPGRESIPISEIGDTRLPGPTPETIINTEMHLITGRELTRNVVNTIGVDNLYPRLAGRNLPASATQELAAIDLSKNLEVQKVAGSNLIEVNFRHENPQIAAKALSALLEGLKDRHVQVFSTANSGFLEEQLKSYQEKLQHSQRVLGRFRQDHQLASEEQGDLLAGKRADLESTLTQETSRLAELEEKLAFLKSRPGVYFTAASELRNQLNLLRRKEQELTQKYKDESQPLSALKDDIRLVEKQLKEQEDNMRNTECFKVESEIKPLRINIDDLKKQIQQVDSKTLTFGKNSVELQDLKREVAANEANYSIYLKKVEEARISENMDERRMTNITIVQRPAVPAVPDGQKRTKVLSVGLLMSLALGFGVAFIFESVSQTFLTPESVEKKLSVPLLATLEHRKNKEV
ncbi:MAG: GumC family protein [Syntrophorhabdales bacterium]|jgi:uncharacterized protein involved in exopolysaccharide biosynthesis